MINLIYFRILLMLMAVVWRASEWAQCWVKMRGKRVS